MAVLRLNCAIVCVFYAMNIDHLHTFLEVLATGSFHRAAANFNVTQSSLSARIRALQERLDRCLFLRHKQGAR